MNIKLNRVDIKVESHLHIQWKQKKNNQSCITLCLFAL